MDPKRTPSLAVVVLLIAVASTAASAQELPLGYDDTPRLPDMPWLVHDANRPQPEIVTPGATFSEGALAPSDAVVLFDGSDLGAWRKPDGSAPGWKVEHGYFEVVPGTGSIRTREVFGDFQLHIEWATPHDVVSNSQGRGNSGVFYHGKYEVQLLDSFENPTYPDGQAGALYGQTPPLVNASRPPGAWQTYDILFSGPRFDGDRLVRAASVTVLHNGVALHHRKELIGGTVHRRVGTYEPHEERGFIQLQDHSNPMRFRNIWIRELGDYDQPE